MNMNHGHDIEQNYILRVILQINANHIEGNNGSYYFFSTLKPGDSCRGSFCNKIFQTFSSMHMCEVCEEILD